MENDNLWLVFKVTMIAVMLSLLLWFRFDQMSITISASIFLSMAAIMMMRKRYPERYRKDERTQKVSAYAASWSWMVTLLVVTFLFWFDYLGMNIFTAGQTITVVFLTMVASIIAFRIIAFRRGDL